jgi:preprotein translocase subunit SecE
MNFLVVAAIVLAASIVAGGLATAATALVVRLRPFDAAARHALWYATLIVIAFLQAQ